MREIKFMARHIKNKQWYFGVERDTEADPLLPLGIFWLWIENGIFDRKTLGEYTGLHSKNGKEIYEGDIVHTFSRVGRGFRDRGVDKVHYSDITARWYPLDIVVTEMCEVIGSIWETPELLETK